MCGLLQCGPAFDPNGLSTGGYLYNWLQTVLNSPKERVGIYGGYFIYFFICSVVVTKKARKEVLVAQKPTKSTPHPASTGFP